MSAPRIPTAATPPTQPAMPAPKWATDAVERECDARARQVRTQALHAAVQYAGAGLIGTIGQFWQSVDAFEQYIGTGEHL